MADKSQSVSRSEPRAHTPSAYSRTANTSLTAKDKAKMEQLKRKMTFTDEQPPPQPPPADGAPDPSDAGAAAAFEVERPSLQELLERPIQGKGKVIISSEQLKQLAVVLNNPKVLFDILEKLHQLQAYEKDASTLYRELMKGKASDPEDTQQLVRMASLIGDIKQHELSYLKMLQQLMVQALTVPEAQFAGQGGQDHGGMDDTLEEEGEGEGQEEGNDRESGNEESDGGELEKEESDLTEEQLKELARLQEQKALLERLLAQQRHMRELEEKQSSLMALRQQAEARLQAMKEGDGSHSHGSPTKQLNNGDVVEDSAQEEKENAQGSAKEEEREEEEGEEEGQEREGEELDSESKAALMKELVELKERKDRLCRLVAELEEYGERYGDGPEVEKSCASSAQATQAGVPTTASRDRVNNGVTASLTPPLPAAWRMPSTRTESQKVTWSAPPGPAKHKPRSATGPVSAAKVVSQAVENQAGPSEMVKVLPPEMEEKLRKLDTARGKLQDVQKMLSQAGLNDSSIASSPEKGTWNNESDSQKENRSQTDDGEVVDEDVAHLYQSRIAQQKAELEALVAQKKELLQLRDMLRQLQVQEAKAMAGSDAPEEEGESQEDEEEEEEEEGEESDDDEAEDEGRRHPTNVQEHQLYEELMKRNRQLRMVQRKGNEAEEQDANSAQYSWDVTAATWGGSTAHTVETEGSEYSAEGFDTSRDVGERGEHNLHALAGQLLSSQYLQLGEQAAYLSSRPTAGDSAVLEEESPSRGTYTVSNVPVSVERHTPRQYDGIQRPTVEGYSAGQSAPAPRSSGKKRRLESDTEYWAEKGYARDADDNPQLFPHPQSAGIAGSFHSPMSADHRGCVAPPYMHTAGVQELHHRLAESSAMCSELLRSQVQLVNMVSQRLSDSCYGMPAPWPYAPYYSPYSLQPPRSDQAPLLPTGADYMQKLQQYHAALQEAHYRLMSHQSGPSSMGDREQQAASVPSLGSQSINLPPPPPPPAGLFGSPYRSAVNFASPPTFNFTPSGFPFEASLGNTSHSNNIVLAQDKPVPRLGASHLTGPADQGHHPRSPSGVTADSIQVVAPSSPQSAYSSVRPAQEGEQDQPFMQSGMGAASVEDQQGTHLHRGQSASVPTVSSRNVGGAQNEAVASRSNAYASLAGRARQLALEEFKAEMSGTWPSAGGLQQMAADGGAADDESESSMPCSIPSDVEAAKNKRASKVAEQATSEDPNSSQSYSLFDALRESIYSEVATLIANNESRPHFLIELFRELQLLTTDYLRQRALYGVQDLVTRFLTEEGMEAEATGYNPMTYQSWLGSASEQTPSESVATSEVVSEGEVPGHHRLLEASKQTYDYSEQAESATSVSTPHHNEDEPFASDNLGDTVIHFGTALRQIRESDLSLTEGDATLVVGTPTVGGDKDSTDQECVEIPVDPQQLDSEIKAIMMQVIPLLRDHLAQPCTVELLANIQQYMIVQVMDVEMPQKEFAEVFQRQLETSLAASVAKYQGKVLRDCVEDLMVDLSEVLFNELGFFRVLQDMKVDPTSLSDPSPQVNQSALGALASAMTATLHEEEESLGKTRDDDMAAACNFATVKSMSTATDSDQTPGPEHRVPSPPEAHLADMEKQGAEGASLETAVAQDGKSVEEGTAASPDNEVEVPAGLEGNEDAEKKEKEEDKNKEGEDEEGENEEEEEEKKDTESKEMNESGMQRDEEEEEEKEEEEEDEEEEEEEEEKEEEEEGQVEETDESRTQESEQKEGAGGSKANGEEEGAMEITEASGSSSMTDTVQSVSDLPLDEQMSFATNQSADSLTSLDRGHVAALRAEEQKTVEGVSGILESLAQVPELVGSDDPLEPDSHNKTVPEP